MKLSLRDLFWLLLVVGIGLGWWIDQDRIRRERAAFADEREKFRREAQSLHTLPLRYAVATLQVTEAELASSMEVNQRNPGAISESEMQRLKLELEVARLDVEKAQTKESFGPATSAPQKGQASN
jgi:hypothetical protein